VRSDEQDNEFGWCELIKLLPRNSIESVSESHPKGIRLLYRSSFSRSRLVEDSAIDKIEVGVSEKVYSCRIVKVTWLYD
jgi:hypothetical protein